MQIVTYSNFPLELKKEWNRLVEQGTCNVPFLRYEYLEQWWLSRGGGEWPTESSLAILAGFEGEKLIGVAPFFITEHEGPRRLILLGSHEISDYLDLIVTVENARVFITALLQFIHITFQPQGILAVDFYNLLEESATVNLLTELASSTGYSISQQRLSPAPRISLPGDWEAYLASIDKKQRHEIRRKMRRATEGDVIVEMVFTTDPSHLEGDSETFLALMAQDPEKSAFLTPVMQAQMKGTIRGAFANGFLQLAFLKIGGTPAAAYLNFDYDNRIWVYNSGLDRAFNEYSPGWVLLGHLLQWANEHNRSEFDFMRGDEDYKYKFGALDRFVCRVTLQNNAD